MFLFIVNAACNAPRPLLLFFSAARILDEDETEILNRVVKAAPHADPCPMIVHFADELLDRDGAMSDALDDLDAPRSVLSAPTTLISLSA